MSYQDWFLRAEWSEYAKDPHLLSLSEELKELISAGENAIALELLHESEWSLVGLFNFEKGLHILGVPDKQLLSFLFELSQYCSRFPEGALGLLSERALFDGELLRLAFNRVQGHIDFPLASSEEEAWLFRKARELQHKGDFFSIRFPFWEPELAEPQGIVVVPRESKEGALQGLKEAETVEQEALSQQSIERQWEFLDEGSLPPKIDLWASLYLVTLDMWKGYIDVPFELEPNLFRPVSGVYGHQVFEFCNKRSEEDGFEAVYSVEDQVLIRNPLADGYRLPTESEWLSLAIADTAWPYAGGMFPENVGWFLENGRRSVRCIGQLQPNKWGLFDMSGNVEELCEPDSFYPTGLPRGTCARRYGFGRTFMLHGGNVISSHREAKLTRKPRRLPISAKPTFPVGFRLVRSIWR